jgi:hypothetical protein
MGSVRRHASQDVGIVGSVITRRRETVFWGETRETVLKMLDGRWTVRKAVADASHCIVIRYIRLIRDTAFCGKVRVRRRRILFAAGWKCGGVMQATDRIARGQGRHLAAAIR